MAQGTPRRKGTRPRAASRKPASKPTARKTPRQRSKPVPSRDGAARRKAGPAKRRTVAERARQPRQAPPRSRSSAEHGPTARERDGRPHDHAVHQGYDDYDTYGDGGYGQDALGAPEDPQGYGALRLREHPVLLLTIVLYAVVWVLAFARFWQLTPAGGVLRWALAYLYGLMTVAGFCVSAAVGTQRMWGAKRWLVVVAVGLFEMLLVLLTLVLYHGGDIEVVALPPYLYLLLGMFIALLGMLGGLLLVHTRKEG